MPEHIDQCRETLLAVGIDVEARIVEEAGAGSQTDAALAHIA